MTPEYYHTTIVSSMGTSILTNKAPAEMPELLRRTANVKQLSELPGSERSLYEGHHQRRHAELLAGDEQLARAMSAELNGLLALGLPLERTHHLLLCTDTLQGKAAAEIVKDWLQQRNARSVEVCPLTGMTTASQHDFDSGVDTLLNLCDQRLKPLREQQRHRILFNLVGGFKSLQAYLQMLGMIYADETCYLFEASGSPLLRIPRLPLRFDIEPLERSAALMARLAEGDIVPQEQAADVPSVYLEVDGGDACLNNWGKLVWNSEKENILSGNLLEHPGIAYEPSFQKDYEKITQASLRVAIQEAVAKAAVLWASGGLGALRKDGGLLYETYTNRDGVGHFRVGQGPRISCLPDGGGLRLRHVGAHDYVNNNP